MFRLCFEFFKIGLFAMGGGLATLPFLQELGERTGWFTSLELADMIAVSESTPGPIGVNMATYAGYRGYGIMGGILATLFLVLPSLMIILMISQAMYAFQNSAIVNRAFKTLRPATAGLILAAVQNVALVTLLNLPAYQRTKDVLSLFRPLPLVFFVGYFILIHKFDKLHPGVFLFAGAVLGVIFQL